MKSVFVVLVAVASLGVVGCGDQKTEAKPTTTAAASPKPAAAASGTPAASASAAPAGGGW